MGILVLSLAFVCVYECVRYVLVRVCVWLCHTFGINV